MAGDRHRRRRRTRTAAGTCTGDGEPPPARTSIHDLPDELLEQVLLRVRTPFCLFRAMATCKLWRRVIAGDGKDSSLHRASSLHRRPNHLLGHYIVEPSTAPEFVAFPARPAFHLHQRLFLDFPNDGQRILSSSVLTDSRGGLLAFVHENLFAVVCDPWTSQYRMLDEFPWGPPVEDPGDRDFWYDCLGAFILDASDDGDEKSSLMSSFSVLCVCLITDLMDDTRTAEACVFSAKDNAWIRRTSSVVVCTDLSTREDMDQRFVGRAGGSIFFSGIDAGRVLLVIDEATGNFSTMTLPLLPDHVYRPYVDRGNLPVVNGGPGSPYVDRGNLRVVNEGPGSPVCIVRLVKDDLMVLEVMRVHGGWECMVERSVDLCQLANIEFSCATRSWRFLDTATVAAAATLVLGAFSPSSTLLFSLDVETMKLQRANKMTTMTLDAKRVSPYELPWPTTRNLISSVHRRQLISPKSKPVM